MSTYYFGDEGQGQPGQGRPFDGLLVVSYRLSDCNRVQSCDVNYLKRSQTMDVPMLSIYVSIYGIYLASC